MNVIDLVLAVLMIAAIALETKRGFGRAIFDFAALFISVRVASLVAPGTAKAYHIAKDAPANEAIWLAALFLLFAGILLYIGKLAYDRTQLTLEVFDPLIGAALGIGLGVIVCHVLVTTLAVSAGVNGQLPDVITNSGVGSEFYSFDTYHRVMDFMYNLGG